MNKLLSLSVALALIGSVQMAEAALTSYNVTTTWYEPMTQPYDSIFTGSFTYDDVTKTVSGLQGHLTESMTGTAVGPAPYYDMTQLNLSYQLQSWYDVTLGGTFAATFLKNTTNTFSTNNGGDGWSPASGIANNRRYHNWPQPYANSIQNAYVLIFVPDDPTALLTQAQLDKLAYADCTPGGMMMAVCMTSTSVAGYGAGGSMAGYPLSQTISATAVPVPATLPLMASALALSGFAARRRRGAN